MRSEQPTALLIDDDEFTLERLTKLLRDDFDVHTAKTANDGLRLFEQIINTHFSATEEGDL